MMLAISRSKDPKASAPYLSLLKLSRPPFSDELRQGEFHADPARSQTLDMLQHLAQYSEELLLVSGPEGSGKSALLEQFLSRAEEHWSVCQLKGGEGLEADRLFSHIAECFGIKLGAGTDDLLGALQQQLGAVQAQRLPVLVIDEAQALSDDALEMVMHLASLEGEHGKLIRIILLADESLVQRLETERFAAMPRPHRLAITPFDESGVRAYLTQRLQQAGLQGELPFTDREIKRLHKQSEGLPGRLNEAAHELLQEKLASKKPVGKSRRYLQMGLAASALFGTVFGLQDKINALLAGDTQNAAVTAPERPVVRLADVGNPWAVVIRDGESIQINCGPPGSGTVGVRPMLTAALDSRATEPLSRPMIEDFTPGQPEVPPQEGTAAEVAASPEATVTPGKETAQEEAEVEEQAEVAAVEQPPQDEAAPEPAAEEPSRAEVDENDAPAQLQLTGVEPEPVPAGRSPQQITLNGSGFQPDSKVAVSHGGRVSVLQNQQVKFVDSEQLAITITPGEQPSQWAAQVSTPDNRRSNVLRFEVAPQQTDDEEKPPSKDTGPEDNGQPPEQEKKAAAPVSPEAAATKPADTGAGEVNGYDWYAARADDAYTLQLLASESRQNTEEFIAENDLDSPLGVFAMERNGKQLYALTQGHYLSRQQAERAASALPPALKPWVRSVGSIKKVMQRSAAPNSGGKDMAWVWSQKPAHFTVQLAAASSEDAIEATRRRLSLPGKLAVIETVRNGEPWFALVYGSFASKEAARGTISRLPASLRQAGPWPRSFADLQDEISRTGQAR